MDVEGRKGGGRQGGKEEKKEGRKGCAVHHLYFGAILFEGPKNALFYNLFSLLLYI